MKKLLFLACLFCLGASAQNLSTSGTISAASTANTCTATSCVYYQLPSGATWVTLQIGGTWSGSVGVYSITSQNATYQNLNSQTWTQQANLTANGTWAIAAGNSTFILVQSSSFSSGKANITMTASSTGSPLINPILAGNLTVSGISQATASTSSQCWSTQGGVASCGYGPGTVIPISSGGTGATTAAQALTNLGALPLAGGTMTGPLNLDVPLAVGNGGTGGNNQTSAFNNIVAPGGTITGTLNLTTPLSIPNGGSGQNNANAAMTAFGITQTGTVGTSSQLDTFPGSVAATKAASASEIYGSFQQPVTQATGAYPENMPAFHTAARGRYDTLWGPLIQSTDFKQPESLPNYAFGTMVASGYDLGNDIQTPVGIEIAPTGSTGAQTWSALISHQMVQTSYEVATVKLVHVAKYSGTGSVQTFVTAFVSQSQWVEAVYNENGNTLSISINGGGTMLTGLGSVNSPYPLESGDRLSLVYNGPFAYAVLTKSYGARVISTPAWLAGYGGFDLRILTNLVNTPWFWGFGQMSITAGNSSVFSDFNVNEFGGFGTRDYSWVKYEDGTPYYADGLYYFLADVPGLNDGTHSLFASTYQGVFSFDPLTYKIARVGRLLWQYDTTGGVTEIVPDQAGQVVYDRIHQQWMTVTVTFGSVDNDNVLTIAGDIRYDNPLFGTHILDATTINMAGYTNEMWDPQWVLVNGTWNIAATVSTTTSGGTAISAPGLFFAAEATPFTVTSGSWIIPTSGVSQEGTVIVNTGNGTYRLLAGQTNSNTIYSYSLSPFAEVATFTVPHDTSIGSPAQHADMISNYNRGTLSDYFMLGFGTDEINSITNSWGSYEVYLNGINGNLVGYGHDVSYVSRSSHPKDVDVNTTNLSAPSIIGSQYPNQVNLTGGKFTTTTVAALGLTGGGVGVQMVSDSTGISTQGQTCVGGSTTTALAVYDGTAWRCFGMTPPNLAAPTISSGFGTSPSVYNTYTTPTSFGFGIKAGSGSPTSGVMAIPSPTTGASWQCNASDPSNPYNQIPVPVATSTTLTIYNYTWSGAAVAWNTGDFITASCHQW